MIAAFNALIEFNRPRKSHVTRCQDSAIARHYPSTIMKWNSINYFSIFEFFCDSHRDYRLFKYKLRLSVGSNTIFLYLTRKFKGLDTSKKKERKVPCKSCHSSIQTTLRAWRHIDGIVYFKLKTITSGDLFVNNS